MQESYIHVAWFQIVMCEVIIDTSFDAGVDAYLLHMLTYDLCFQSQNLTNSIVPSDYLKAAVARVLQYGQNVMQSYWEKALDGHRQDNKTQNIHNVSVYSCAVACIDSYVFLVEDIESYSVNGGGALRVLCKRSLTCYYASVLMLDCKLHSM
jgi:hypothetical protein